MTLDVGEVALLVPNAVHDVLEIADTWLAWDGRPHYGEHNVWTPHKAMRRVEDHLLDHYAEMESALAGQSPIPDTWHGRSVTLDSDWARFTECDLDEAGSRLRRYAQLYRSRVEQLSAEELERQRPGSWTISEIVIHVAGIVFYAHQVGRLALPEPQ